MTSTAPTIRDHPGQSVDGQPHGAPARASVAEMRPTRTTTRTIGFACAAMLVSYLPFSAVNGAPGTIGAETRAGTADLQWLADAFALALAAVVLSAGVIGERVGRRQLTVAGLGLTAAGAVVACCGGAVSGRGSVHLLWAAQALAGIGGGAVMSATLGLVTGVAGDDIVRRRAIAVWAAAITVGLGAGPFLPAAITAWASWRWMFAPIAAAAVVVAAYGHRYAVEVTTAARRRLDLPGQTASTAAIVALVYAMVRGGTAGWTNLIALAAFGTAIVFGLAFLLLEKRSSAPLLHPELFASRGFAAAGVAAAITLFSLVGLVFTLSLMYAHDGASDLAVATRLGSLFAANAAASVASAGLQARFGPVRVLVGGLVLAAAGATLLTLAPAGAGFNDNAWRLVVTGLGCGMVMATASGVAVAAAPRELMGMAGAVNNAVRQLGAALGAAVLGSVLAERLATDDTFTTAAHICSGLLAGLLAIAALGCGVLLARPTTG